MHSNTQLGWCRERLQFIGTKQMNKKRLNEWRYTVCTNKYQRIFKTWVNNYVNKERKKNCWIRTWHGISRSHIYQFQVHFYFLKVSFFATKHLNAFRDLVSFCLIKLLGGVSKSQRNIAVESTHTVEGCNSQNITHFIDWTKRWVILNP